ncbi:uncharacterized protein METZ01_LOCUS387042 [marine metagenome]|uniref:Uncharacterized protein n=1 Tax=marine metagenome TaxID=408172 RepID=A0A382UKG3_9ZZZZ
MSNYSRPSNSPERLLLRYRATWQSFSGFRHR